MNDTLIFFVLAMIALVFKWLTKLGAEKNESQPPPSPNNRTPRPPAQSEQERVRRFLEALGVPPGTEPPAPIRRREVVPRRASTPPRTSPKRPVQSKWQQPLPPLTTSPLPPPVVTEIPPPAPIAPPSAPPPPPPVQPLPAAIRRSEVTPTVSLRPSISLGELLRRRESVQQAVLLREILGPPRGLQAPAQRIG